jgi:hypothetical protein
MVLAARPLHGVPLLVIAALALDLGGDHLLPLYALDFALGVVTSREQKTLAGVWGAIPPGMGMAMVLAALLLQAMPLLLGRSIPMAGLLVAPRDPGSVAMMSVGA